MEAFKFFHDSHCIHKQLYSKLIACSLRCVSIKTRKACEHILEIACPKEWKSFVLVKKFKHNHLKSRSG